MSIVKLHKDFRENSKKFVHFYFENNLTWSEIFDIIAVLLLRPWPVILAYFLEFVNR